MKISLSWLKNHIDLPESPEQISDLLTNCGLEVEDLQEIGSPKGLEELKVGLVKEVSVHPNADKLKLTKVDIGGENTLNIVCGAPNVEAGQKVIVAPVGCTIYPTNGEPLTMRKAKIRGELSEGMICAEDEIGLGSSHDGIKVLANDTPIGPLKAGFLSINSDCVLEIGLTPNRGDAASHLGVARDLKALLDRNLNTIPSQSIAATKASSININIDDPDGCNAYNGLLIKNVKVVSSPPELQSKLKAIGIQPINAIVDIGNYIMMDIGQPMHAFDFDKIGNTITVRMSGPGESLITLDKTERKLNGEELIIADENGPLAIAGVMGGLKSSITENTTNVYFESAWFDPSKVRRSAKKLGLSTDSSFRFERGINPKTTYDALEKAAEMVRELFPESEIFLPDQKVLKKAEPQKIKLNKRKISSLVGTNIEDRIIENILKNLDIEIESENEGEFKLNVPPYRYDVVRDVDVIEEILRIYGFNKIPMPEVLHSAAVVQEKPDKTAVLEKICNYLSSIGFSEIKTNSLSAEDHYNEHEVSSAVHLLNPLSKELSILRPSMLPSLLQAIAFNRNRKQQDLKFYELGKTYKKTEKGYLEIEKLALAICGKRESANWLNKPGNVDEYYLKTILKNLMRSAGVLNPKIPSLVMPDQKDLLKFDINQEVLYAEINVESLMNTLRNQVFELEEIPVFPEVHRDLNLIFDSEVSYQEIEKLAVNSLGTYLRSISLADVYEGKPLETGQKSYTLNLLLYDKEKTMNDKQIDALMKKLIHNFENKLKAIIRK
ncbi:MAG: phenylalanine--tRNA ligase subunit beta [Flavobacteriales bacterium]|nr:phenylalanine--tRNA ligase subunit beta [Flavobacteriales bacterium]